MPTAVRSHRTIVLALGTSESVVALLFIGLMLQPTDPLGKAIGQGMTRLTAIPALSV